MSKFAIISDNKVINIVMAEESYAITRGWTPVEDGVNIGFDYINNQFVDNRPPASDPIPAPELTKDQLVSQLQILADRIAALE